MAALQDAAASVLPPLGPGSRFAGYDIVGLIGRGGHACVFQGYDPFMGQHVAIKVLYRAGGVTEEMMRRGQAEAQLLNRLRHPNIVEVRRAGVEDGLLFIVMELLQGRSLRALLDHHGRLAIEEVLALAAQIADATAAAHEHKAIHRDLKPDNVFVTTENRVKVLDFGVAKLMDQGGFTTQKDIVVGTMLYMSPEQLQGMPLTPLSDVYALGLIMYTALAGIHPCLIGVQTPTFEELARNQVLRHPPLLSELDPSIPAHVARLVARALSKLPEERTTSMRQFAADIRASLERHVAEVRSRHQVLQTRDLSRTEPGSRNVPPRTSESPMTRTETDVFVVTPAGGSNGSGPGDTAPLPRLAPVAAPTPPPTQAQASRAPARMEGARSPGPRSLPGAPRAKRVNRLPWLVVAGLALGALVVATVALWRHRSQTSTELASAASAGSASASTADPDASAAKTPRAVPLPPPPLPVLSAPTRQPEPNHATLGPAITLTPRPAPPPPPPPRKPAASPPNQSSSPSRAVPPAKASTKPAPAAAAKGSPPAPINVGSGL